MVDVAMTAAATRFVGPLTFKSLTHRPVLDDVSELDADRADRAHRARRGRRCDRPGAGHRKPAPGARGRIGRRRGDRDRVRQPCTGDRGAGDGRRHVDPFPATQRNVAQLRGFGYLIVEPEVGELASGLTGIGRLAEPSSILEAIERSSRGPATSMGCRSWSAPAGRESRSTRCASSAIAAAARWGSRSPRRLATGARA